MANAILDTIRLQKALGLLEYLGIQNGIRYLYLKNSVVFIFLLTKREK